MTPPSFDDPAQGPCTIRLWYETHDGQTEVLGFSNMADALDHLSAVLHNVHIRAWEITANKIVIDEWREKTPLNLPIKRL